MINSNTVQGVLREYYNEYGAFSIYISSMDEYWRFAKLFNNEVEWRSGAELQNPLADTLLHMENRILNGLLYLNIESGVPRLQMGNSTYPEYHPVFTIESFLSIRKLQPISVSKWEELLWI